MREEVRRSLLPLDELQQVLTDLENGSFTLLTDSELRDKIQAIHNGFVIQAPILSPGTLIYRAVKVSQRPAHKSRISYPPIEMVTTNGRLNRAGEGMFYGSFHRFASCLHECSCNVGDFFAVSAWLTTEKMIFNHLGYSNAVLRELKSKRDLPFFARTQEEPERNRLFREWQARVFSKRVPPDQTHLYRLPIALKDFALARIVQTDPEAPDFAFSGVIYPSVAMWLLEDNVAILPAEVDSKLALCEVILLSLDAIKEIRNEDGSIEKVETTVKTYEFARADLNGNLIWGQKSQVIPQPGTDASERTPQVLPAE